MAASEAMASKGTAATVKQLGRCAKSARAVATNAHAAVGLCSSAKQLEAVRLLRVAESSARNAAQVLGGGRNARSNQCCVRFGACPDREGVCVRLKDPEQPDG